MTNLAFLQAFRAALELLNTGRLEEAAATCAQLRHAAPNDPAVLQLDATLALRRDQPAQALRLIRRSLDLRPGHAPSMLIAARAALALGDLEQAAAALEELPDQASEWQALGLAAHRAGKPTLALLAFTRAIAADPLLGTAHFGYGLVLHEAGRLPQARQALQRAVALDPEMSSAWFALGLTLQDLQDEAAAAAAFEQALRVRADFAEAAVNLGIARQRLGDMEAATEAYRRAIKIRPDSFGRIAQAVTASATGMLWLDLAAFRSWLGA